MDMERAQTVRVRQCRVKITAALDLRNFMPHPRQKSKIILPINVNPDLAVVSTSQDPAS